TSAASSMSSTHVRGMPAQVVFEGPGLQVNGLEAEPKSSGCTTSATTTATSSITTATCCSASRARRAMRVASPSAQVRLGGLEYTTSHHFPPRCGDGALYGVSDALGRGRACTA